MKAFSGIFKLLILVTIPMFIFSCGESKVFEKRVKMKDNKWGRTEANGRLEFKVDIEDTTALYNIDIAIRHTSYYPYANMDLGFYMYYPSGQEQLSQPRIYLRDKDGNFKGKGMGDIWDYDYRVRENFKLTESGTYTIVIRNLTGNKYYLEDIMAIGLLVNKAE